MTTNYRRFRWLLVILALAAAFALGAWGVDAIKSAQPSAVSFGTGFTYQGYLRDDIGDPLTDSCDLTFKLYDALTLGNQVGSDDVITGVAVSNGLFTVVVNDANEFGPAGFNGGGRFLDITVKCSGDATATALSPRQPINPVPYARFAERFAGYENLIIVAKQGGDFVSVTEAVYAIGVDTVYPDASPTNPYLIYVAPGIYADEHVVMKEYVDIEGAGRGVTMITSEGGSDGIKPQSATLVGASNAELRHITVENVSSAPGNWAFAIYTAGATTFSDVTAQASGGSYPRGMIVHDGGFAILKDVSLVASNGSVSSTGLDVYQATTIVDGLFVNAHGGVDAHGLYINDATAPVKLENVTAFVSGGTSQANGVFINASDVSLSSYDTTVSSAENLVTGIYCSGLNSRLNAREISITGSKSDTASSIRGVLASDCDLNLVDASIDVSAPSTAYGLYYTSVASDTKQLEIGQLDIKANSSASVVYGIYVASNPDNETAGQVNDVTIQASGYLTTANSYGLYHSSNGVYQYQDVAVDITGQARFMYGIQASRGTPAFQNVTVDAVGDAEITVFGIEFIGAVAGGSVETARILVENTATADAVGLKSNAPESFNFHNISARVTGSVGVWGYDFVDSIVSAIDIEAHVEANVDDSIMRGIRCVGGSADIHNALLTVQASSSITPTITYGSFISNCDLTLSSSQIRVRSANASRYGLYVSASSGAPSYFVRDSYLSGATAAIRTLGHTDLIVVNTQLEGGAASSGGPDAKSTCTAVTHGSGTSFSFTAGPVSLCP